MSRSYVPFTSDKSSPKGKTFDIGVVIALAEEFDYFLSYLSCSNVFQPPEPKPFWDDGHCFWSFELAHKEESGRNVVQVVAYLVAEMGTEYTGVATTMLVNKWHVPFIVNIGVTGSLDKDLKVGSILMPTQITHYTANAKVKDGDKGSEILIGTRAFATSRVVVSQFANFLASSDYKDWQALCMENAMVPKSADLAATPELFIGHLASGNVVIDSEVYKTELKATDRKLMACEMEAAGFMIAEQFLQASARAVSQFISLRCISDMAANKHTAESGDNMITVNAKVMKNREWAMRNATMLFMFLVERQVINADINAQLGELKEITSQLEARKKETILRPIQRTQTTEEILAIATSKSMVNKLDKQQCITVCADRIPSLNTTNMLVTALRKHVLSHLEESGHVQPGSAAKRSGDRTAIDSRDPKKPRLAESVVASSTSSTAAVSTPARSGVTRDDNEPTQLDEDIEEDAGDLVPLSALQEYADQLNDIIRAHGTVKVTRVQFNSVRASLQEVLDDLQGITEEE